MATSYPNNLDNFTNPINSDPTISATVPHSLQHANANDAIEAMEMELGINPSGAYTDVRARLTAIEAAITALGASAFSSLPDGSITQSKLANLAVITSKLANDSVTSAKIAADSITASKIANNSITQAKLSGMMLKVICTSSTRPVPTVVGQEIFETDTFRSLIWNGSAWVIVDQLGAWSTWAPTWTGLTVGNGTLNSARYLKIGRLIRGNLFFTLGSTSAITGAVSFSLPVSSATNVGTPVGQVTLIDSGTSNYVGIATINTGNNSISISAQNASGNYLSQTALTANIPHTWASTDLISLSFAYEATS